MLDVGKSQYHRGKSAEVIEKARPVFAGIFKAFSPQVETKLDAKSFIDAAQKLICIVSLGFICPSVFRAEKNAAARSQLLRDKVVQLFPSGLRRDTVSFFNESIRLNPDKAHLFNDRGRLFHK